MWADQIAILGDVTTGGEEEEPEVTAAPPSTGNCSGSDNYSPPEGCHVGRSDCYSRLNYNRRRGRRARGHCSTS